MLGKDFVIRHATRADLKPIEALRRADSDALGFIPGGAQGLFESVVDRVPHHGRHRYRYAWLLVATDNLDITGYVYCNFSEHHGKSLLNIYQVCVREDARRFERALRLVDTVEQEARARRLQHAKCRVAYDIEANLFWQAAGWTPVTLVTSTYLNHAPSKKQRPLWEYRKALYGERQNETGLYDVPLRGNQDRGTGSSVVSC